MAQQGPGRNRLGERGEGGRRVEWLAMKGTMAGEEGDGKASEDDDDDEEEEEEERRWLKLKRPRRRGRVEARALAGWDGMGWRLVSCGCSWKLGAGAGR